MFTIVAVTLAAGLLVILWRARRRPLMPESVYQIEFDDDQITVIFPQGNRHSVRWRMLTRVGIRTTDEGPWSPDVFWGFHENSSTEATVVFPGGASGESELLSALQTRLPGFRNEELIRAMASTSNAYFVVWESGEPQE